MLTYNEEIQFKSIQFKEKGEATDCGNYRGLKLLEHVMKVLERVLESLVCSKVDIKNMQFGCMPGRSMRNTDVVQYTDAIYILRQMQEKHLVRKKKIYFAFVDLENIFDRVPLSILWWAMRKFGIDEWVVRLVNVMYDGANSSVRVSGCFSERFEVTVGVHQGFALSPLLFSIVIEAFSRELRIYCPRELRYADDLVIMSDNFEDLKI